MKETPAFIAFKNSLDHLKPADATLLQRAEALADSVDADATLTTIVGRFRVNGNLEQAMRACGDLFSIGGVSLMYLLSGEGRADILSSILRPIIYGEWCVSKYSIYGKCLKFVAHFTRATFHNDWLTPVMANGRHGPFLPGDVHQPFLRFVMHHPIVVSRFNWQDDYTLPSRGPYDNFARVLIEAHYYYTGGRLDADFDPKIILNAEKFDSGWLPALRSDVWKAWFEAGVPFTNYAYISPEYLECAVGVGIITDSSIQISLLDASSDLSANMIFGGSLNWRVQYTEEGMQDDARIGRRISSDINMGILDADQTAYPFYTASRRNGGSYLAEVSLESGVPPELIRAILRHDIGLGYGRHPFPSGLHYHIVEAVSAAGIRIFYDGELSRRHPFIASYNLPGLPGSDISQRRVQVLSQVMMGYAFADTIPADGLLMPARGGSSGLRITDSTSAVVARRPQTSSGGGVPDSSLPAADGVPVPDLSRAQIWNALEAMQVVFRRVLIFAKPVELSLDLAKFVLVPTGRYFMTAALSTGHYMALKGHFYVGTGISLAALTYTFSALGMTEALIALGSTLAYVAAPFATNYLAASIAAITGLSFVNVAAVTGAVLLGAAAISAVSIIFVKTMEFTHPQIWLESQEAWAYVGRSFSSYGVHTTDADLRTSADFSASSSEVSTPPCCVQNIAEADTSLPGHCVPCNINAIET